MSSSSLISGIESDLTANAPQGVSAPSSTQLTQMATNIANGTGPGGTGSSSSSTAQSNLSTLAQSLGVDPTTLLDQLTSGQGLSSLLSSGDTGYGSSATDTYSGGVAYDEYA